MSDLKQLNEKLADSAYINGFTPSQEDVAKFKSLFPKYDEYVHIMRWAKNLASFSEVEMKAFPGAPAAAGKQASAKPAAKASGDDDDDDMDLFGSDEDEEAEKAKEERAKQLAAQKKGNKPAVIAKSNIVLDVKVWDDETDLNEVEKLVRQITKDGLIWGAAKKVPLAFGVCKLQIVCVVEDEKVSVDWLTDSIEELELVQSTDIAAFQKV